MKANPSFDTKGKLRGWMILCPACGHGHLFDVGRWTFNGDQERPTFKPSMLVNGSLSKMRNPDGSRKYPQAQLCHSFVTDGRIQFLSDCTHSMAGQTTDLPDED